MLWTPGKQRCALRFWGWYQRGRSAPPPRFPSLVLLLNEIIASIRQPHTFSWQAFQRILATNPIKNSTVSTTALYLYASAHLFLIFLVSVSLGLCLARSHCVYIACFFPSQRNGARDVLAPIFLVAGYAFNLYAFGRLVQQLTIRFNLQKRP